MISLKNKKYYWQKMMICSFAIILSNCKIPYEPKLKSSDTNSLVVEGYIDGSVPVVMKLSRTRMLTNGDTAAGKYELGAKVIVEDDQQNSFPLTEMGNGVYSSLNTLSLNAANKYRLHIFTSDNREYISDFVPFKVSQPIDSINWEIKDGGVQTYVNTHDPNNASIYYRWEYIETWEFHTSYPSYYEYVEDSNTVIPRTDQIYYCWKSDTSTNIFLGSSAILSSDVISESPLAYIQPHDQKISYLYSIWVKQYIWDLNGYNYFLAMRNNTESVGSIFDSQPNETPGNIHCVTNPAETVVGYINAGATVEKRIFISNSSLPDNWNIYVVCPERVVPNVPDSLRFYFTFTGGYTPIQLAPPASLPPAAYISGYSECVDCTLHGSNVKPSFWP